MKKLITPIVSILLSVFLSIEIAFGQGGNLQFNQVINISPGGTYTVPTGKVFKIESVSSSKSILTYQLLDFTSGGGWYNCNYGDVSYLTIDNMVFYESIESTNQTYPCAQGGSRIVAFPNISFPIWLKAGKSILVSQKVTNILVSGLEFNILN